ncbi:MAG: hypothetical protein HYX97_06920 [Chloroflexi bacterium]|nr:hypothetical protein [Chloroflexota bacterium]
MAKLPTIPKGKYLEDYVAALLQHNGYFVEKSAVERGEAEVLELDILATYYPERIPTKVLFEVKSGAWGFSDIFKLLGWKTYLSPQKVNRAFFVASQVSTDTPVKFFEEKCNQLGITLVAVPDPEKLEPAMITAELMSEPVSPLDRSIWQFSFWMERCTQRVVSQARKAAGPAKGPGEVYQYQELIKNGMLLTGNIRERLSALFDAHFDHPDLSKNVANEMDHILPVAQWPAGTHWSEALKKCEHPLVQAALYYQQKSRLAILKGAVDYACMDLAGFLPKKKTVKFHGLEIPLSTLTPNFHVAVDAIKSIQDFERIPCLWQSFMWKWGAFFLVEKEEDETVALAKEVKMPVESAKQALLLFDKLFPLDSSWFVELQGVKILKLFPCTFRGVGSYLRLCRTKADDYQVFRSPKTPYLATNLSRWHNTGAELLESFGTTA